MKFTYLSLHMKMLRTFIIVFFFTITLPFFAKTLYVDSAQPDDSGNGESWASAKKTLQSAINTAVANDEIWVKTGTYKPTETTDRTQAFSLKNDVSVYGGFAGSETSRDNRNISANPTILSGDIGTTDTKEDNSYHVINNTATSGAPLTSTAILDGFTITAGYADSSFPNNVGAAIYNHYASPTIRNCTTTANEAILNGGAIYNSLSSPVIDSCTFSSNKVYGSTVEIAGGAIYNSGGSPVISNSTFSSNSAESTREAGGKGMGGAIYNSASSLTMTDCAFTSNKVSGTNTESAGAAIFNDLATTGITVSITDTSFYSNTSDQGGALYNSGSLNAQYSTLSMKRCTFKQNQATIGGTFFNFQFFSASFTNCTFYANKASNSAETLGSGGVAYNDNTLANHPVFTNCTLSGNQSVSNGGAISNIKASPVIKNSIFWNNSSSGINEIYDDSSSAPTVSYCVIEGGYASGSNIQTSSPNLSTLTDNGGKTNTMAITAGSSAIDNGTATDAPATDQRSVPRPQDSATDIGAFERVAPASSLAFSNVSSDRLTLSWSNGGGTNRAVFANKTDSTTAAPSPVHGTSYTANANFGSGSQIGSSGWYCVYNGNDNSVTVTELSRNTTYRFMVCEYLTVNSAPIYTTETSGTNPASQATLDRYTVTFTAGSNGTISGTTPQSIETGGNCTEVTAVPDAHYKFVNWTLSDGTAYSTSAAITVTNVTSSIELTANFSILTYTITATAGDHGSISPSGSITLAYNASQTFTITADTGYTIDDVVVDGTSVGAATSYTFNNVAENHTIQALFAPNYSEEDITVLFQALPDKSGLTSPENNVTIKAGTAMAITATAEIDYKFSSWSIDGVGTFEDSASASTNLIPYSNCTVTANFIRIDSGDLAITVVASPTEGGTATSSASKVQFGKTVDLAATPTASNDFLYWTLDGNGLLENPTSKTTSAIVYGNLTITAIFGDSTETATLVLKTEGGGVVTPVTSHVKKGGKMTIQALPYDTYLFAGWEINSGDASFDSANDKYNTKATITLNSNTEITAKFKLVSTQPLEDKLKLDIFKTSKKVNRDWVRLVRAYLPLTQTAFNAELEKTGSEVRIVIDGNVFDIDKTILMAKQRKQGYSYISADRKVRLNINFRKSEWTFRAKQTTLSNLDYSDHINVVFFIGDKQFGGNFKTTIAANWRIKKSSSESFDILNAYSKMSDLKENKDIIRIKQGTLNKETNLFSSKSMILSIDNWQAIIPAFSFDPLQTIRGIYKFPDKADRKKYKHIQMALYPWFNQWKFNQSKMQINNTINILDGLNVYLLNGDTEEYKYIPVDDIIYSMRLRFKGDSHKEKTK